MGTPAADPAHILRALGHLSLLVTWQDELAALAPLPAVVIANLALRERWAWYANLGIAAASIAAVAALGLGPLLSLPGGREGVPGAAILIASAAIALPCLWESVRCRLARFLPLDPRSPVTMLAVVALVLIVGLQANYQATHDALAAVSRSPELQPIDVIGQELPMLLIALFAVGLFTRRTPAEVLGRLGIVRPAPWQLVAALAVAGIFFALSQGADWVQKAVDPDLYRRLNAATSHYYAGIGGLAGIATIALAPGICEESLFRGALQPRLGLVLAAVAFTAVHTQYALTVDTLLVFALGCALGLIRNGLNTTASITTHAAYNALAGIGIASSQLPIAIGVEVLLVVGALGLWLGARRAAGRPKAS